MAAAAVRKSACTGALAGIEDPNEDITIVIVINHAMRILRCCPRSAGPGGMFGGMGGGGGLGGMFGGVGGDDDYFAGSAPQRRRTASMAPQQVEVPLNLTLEEVRYSAARSISKFSVLDLAGFLHFMAFHGVTRADAQHAWFAAVLGHDEEEKADATSHRQGHRQASVCGGGLRNPDQAGLQGGDTHHVRGQRCGRASFVGKMTIHRKFHDKQYPPVMLG